MLLMSAIDNNEDQYSKKSTGEEIKEASEETATDIEEGAKDVKDKVKAGFKAMGKKISDPDRDLETEYNKEKFKEKTT